MGLSASQARFLQLTARKSNVEYQAQQINFQRLELSKHLETASSEYQDKMSNRKLTYKFNNGTGIVNIDLSYSNYKNYMNEQDKYFLVSSSGNKIVVSSEDEIQKMIDTYPDRGFKPSDFMVADKLDDTDEFQRCIQEGVYYFARSVKSDETDEFVFKTESWETLGGGAISEEYDKSDDAEAEAKYDKLQKEVQRKDKILEMELDKVESERNALQIELDSVTKVIEDNIDKSFKAFG